MRKLKLFSLLMIFSIMQYFSDSHGAVLSYAALIAAGIAATAALLGTVLKNNDERAEQVKSNKFKGQQMSDDAQKGAYENRYQGQSNAFGQLMKSYKM